MEQRSYQALKAIKKEAGKSNSVYMTTVRFGQVLGFSQQSASRLLIELEEKGYIRRKLENRKQVIEITDSGLEVLYGELNELSRILSQDMRVVIEGGEVKSGLGEGRYYVSRKGYIVQFQEKLGFIPYLGTLNVKVDPLYEGGNLRRMRSSEGIRIEGFKTEDRTFGAVKAFRARIGGRRLRSYPAGALGLHRYDRGHIKRIPKGENSGSRTVPG